MLSRVILDLNPEPPPERHKRLSVLQHTNGSPASGLVLIIYMRGLFEKACGVAWGAGRHAFDKVSNLLCLVLLSKMLI